MLADALDQNPKDEMLLGEVVQVFMRLKLYTNALDAVERQLILNPQNTEALVNKGYCQIQLGDYERAIPALTSVLTLGTNSNQRLDTYYKAHLNRAIALLGCNKLEEAQHDYESLQKVFPTAYPVYYGLGEIAWRQKNTNAAIRNYELYLTNSVADSDEAKLVAERLTSLRSTSP